MRKVFSVILVIILPALFFVSCASSPASSSVRVDRVAADTQIDLTGRWNNALSVFVR